MDKINIKKFDLEDEIPICSNLTFILPEEYALNNTTTINVLFNGKVKKSNDIYLLKGICSGELKLPCSKCLDEVCENLSVEILEKFSSNLAVIESDDEIIPFVGQEFDISDCIFQNIILSMPRTVLCSENCNGLCMVCGGNKNVQKCGCIREEPSVFDNILKFFED